MDSSQQKKAHRCNALLVYCIVPRHFSYIPFLPEEINLALAFGVLFTVCGAFIFYQMNRSFSIYGLIRSCGAGRFVGEVPNGFIAGHFILGKTNGLASLSATDAHFSVPYDAFYSELGQHGSSIGNAYKKFFYDSYNTHRRFYDMRHNLSITGRFP